MRNNLHVVHFPIILCVCIYKETIDKQIKRQEITKMELNPIVWQTQIITDLKQAWKITYMWLLTCFVADIQATEESSRDWYICSYFIKPVMFMYRCTSAYVQAARSWRTEGEAKQNLPSARRRWHLMMRRRPPYQTRARYSIGWWSRWDARDCTLCTKGKWRKTRKQTIKREQRRRRRRRKEGAEADGIQVGDR